MQVLMHLSNVGGISYDRKIAELALEQKLLDEYVYFSMRSLDAGDYSDLPEFADNYARMVATGFSNDLSAVLSDTAVGHGACRPPAPDGRPVDHVKKDKPKTAPRKRKSVQKPRRNDSDDRDQDRDGEYHRFYETEDELQPYGDDWHNQYAFCYNDDQKATWDEPRE